MTPLIINGGYAHTVNMDTQTDIKFQLLGNQQREERAWGAQTIQGSTLMFIFSSKCANYSREQTVQGGILIKEIR